MSAAPLPVSTPAVQPRRPVRQVDGVQVSIELQGRSGPPAGQPGDHGRGIRMAGGHALHGEAVGRKQLSQPVGSRAGLPRGAGDLQQRRGRRQQAARIDRVADGAGRHAAGPRTQAASSSSWAGDFTPATTDTTPSRASSQRTA